MLADQLLAPVAQRLFPATVERLDQSLGIDGDDDVGGVFDHPFEVLLGVAQLVLTGLNLGGHGVERILEHPDFVAVLAIEPEVQLVVGDPPRAGDQFPKRPLQQEAEHEP